MGLRDELTSFFEDGKVKTKLRFREVWVPADCSFTVGMPSLGSCK